MTCGTHALSRFDLCGLPSLSAEGDLKESWSFGTSEAVLKAIGRRGSHIPAAMPGTIEVPTLEELRVNEVRDVWPSMNGLCCYLTLDLFLPNGKDCDTATKFYVSIRASLRFLLCAHMDVF